MARPPRYTWPGHAHHLTQRGNNRAQVFHSFEDYQMYLRLLRAGLESAGVRILAYALMPNHVHLVAVPANPDSLSILMRRLSGRFANYSNTVRESTGRFWQGRFYSTVLSPRHLNHALRYVECNPVRAGLVRRPQDMVWSSARAHLTGHDETGVLDMDFWKARGGSEPWDETVLKGNRVTDPDWVRKADYLLRRCTYGERPFGDAEFLSEAEIQFQRKWKAWPYVQSLGERETRQNPLFCANPLTISGTLAAQESR